MDSKLRKFEIFTKSQPFSEALRTSFCIIVPILFFGLNGDYYTAAIVSMGVILASIPDMMGPIKERTNNLLAMILITFVVTLITKYINTNPILLGVFLVIWTFVTSMWGVYGIRASAFGAACLLALFYNMNSFGSTEESPWHHAFLMSCGVVWYALITLILNRVRPYTLARQSLAECMREISDYIDAKAAYYQNDFDKNSISNNLIQKQSKINTTLDNVRTIFFNSKLIIKDATQTGRLLTFIFRDLVDIYEASNAAHYDYVAIQQKYGETKAFQKINELMKSISVELNNVAFFVQNDSKNKSIRPVKDLQNLLKETYDEIQILENKQSQPVVLKKIWINLRGVIQNINELYAAISNENATTSDEDLSYLTKFIKPQIYDLKVIKNHMNFNSPIFRLAIRLTIVNLLGYLISFLLPMNNHSFWILITILVILRPGYSVTKSRNSERLIGTILGGIVGLLSIFLITNNVILCLILFIFLFFNFLYIRNKYTYGSFFLTAFVIISYHFMAGNNALSWDILQERIIDTVIGCALAFASNYLILPSWDSNQLIPTVKKMLEIELHYFNQLIVYVFSNDFDEIEYKLYRKEAYVNLANVSTLLQRMLVEPQKRQKAVESFNIFSIYSHDMISYITAMMKVISTTDRQEINEEHVKMFRKILSQLKKNYGVFVAIDKSKFNAMEVPNISFPTEVQSSGKDGQMLLEQMQLVYNLAKDYNKVCISLAN